MQHFKTLSSYLDYLELPRPEHPMLSVFSRKAMVTYLVQKKVRHPLPTIAILLV